MFKPVAESTPEIRAGRLAHVRDVMLEYFPGE